MKPLDTARIWRATAAFLLGCAVLVVVCQAHPAGREIEPVTMIGIMIQARALVANSEAELDAHGFEGRSGMVLGHELATAVLRIGGMSPGA